MKKLIFRVRIPGIVSESTKKLIDKGFSRHGDENLTLDLFCSFSEFEIPIGTTFNYFEKDNTLIPLDHAMLIAVTQQLGKPFDVIPMGWKTISKFEFSEKDINVLKNELPIIDSWYDTDYYEFSLLKLRR
jgi:hypothetical protein